jgi:hypothetical protein
MKFNVLNGGPSGELPPLRSRRMSGKLKGSSLDVTSVTGSVKVEARMCECWG